MIFLKYNQVILGLFYFIRLALYTYQFDFRRIMREEIVEPNIRYSKIGESRRTKLIDLVIRQGYKTIRASKMLKINQSTAKSIIKLYRSTGTYSVKPKHEKEMNERQKVSFAKEKAQQQLTLSRDNKIEPNEEGATRNENMDFSCYQTSFCVYPSYFPSFYVLFPNTSHQE